MFKELFGLWKNSTFTKTLLLLVLWKIVLLSIVLACVYVLPYQEKYGAQQYGNGLPFLVKIWANFDGFQYLRIAENGYQPDSSPFFPLYPLSIRFFHDTFQLPFLVAGLVVSHLSFFMSLIVMYVLLKYEKLEHHWVLFLSLLLISPTGFFFGAVYNDSLFLFFCCICLYYARERQWISSALFGVLATATRLNGLALAVFMAIEFASSIQEKKKDTWDVMEYFRQLFSFKTWLAVLKTGAFTIILIPITYLAYLSYLQKSFGNWRIIHQVMVVWGQDRVIFPLQVFFRYFRIFLTVPVNTFSFMVAAIEFISVLFYIGICVFAIKKIRFSYWVFVVISFVIPSLTGTFAGMPRYALHLFPFFLTLVLLWKKLPVYGKVGVVSTFFLLQYVILLLFTHGFFVT